MVALTLHTLAWFYNHGDYNAAAHGFQALLHAERHHPGVVTRIHRFMYALNPDWGL